MLVDARGLPQSTVLRHEVCVVGAGPAGIAVACRLAEAGVDVLLIESGGLQQTVHAQNLNRGQVTGYPYWPLHTSRFRLFGGSANRWGGMCRPLDPLDLKEREWVADSGWPLNVAELAGPHADAARFLRLERPGFSAGDWADVLPDLAEVGDSGFENVVYQYSPTKMRFGDHYRAQVIGCPTTTLLTGATVTGLRLDPGTARVGTAVVARRGQGTVTVRAREFVLAAGGIENARLLLASRDDRPAGLGNEHDVVGRYFMEHVQVGGGHLATTGACFAGRAYHHCDHGGAGAVRAALALTPATQREQRLLATALMVDAPAHEFGQPFLTLPPAVTVYPERALRRVTGARTDPIETSTGLRDLGGELWYAARGLRRCGAVRRVRAELARTGPAYAHLHSVYVRAEQVPNRASRVSLGDRRDVFGTPEAVLDWRLAEQDLSNVGATLAHLDARLRATGRGRLFPADPGWRSEIAGGPHHMGTTRMSTDPARGVIDRDARVHSVANLHVAGSSVFPTGGYANPTFMLTALALRLGDHLRDVLRPGSCDHGTDDRAVVSG